MSERYGFFDAKMVNGTPDRVYSADDVNHIFSGILSEGVVRFYGEALYVSAGTAMNVSVDTGKAIIKDHWYVNDTIVNLTIEPAHATLNRYSSVVLRYKSSTRSINLAIINGTPASVPTIPVLTQNDEVYEIRLANVLIKAGVTTMTNAPIVDARVYSQGIVDAPDINYRRYDVTQSAYTSGQRNFDIPESYGLTRNTKLEVYCNGLLCKPNEYELQVNEISGKYMVVFRVARTINSQLSFVMIN